MVGKGEGTEGWGYRGEGYRGDMAERGRGTEGWGYTYRTSEGRGYRGEGLWWGGKGRGPEGLVCVCVEGEISR